MQSSARFAGMVNSQIRSATFTGDQTRISLTPHGLGTIEIDMKRDEAGRMQVVLRADNPMVLSALRGDRDTLSAILTGSGITADGGTLDFQEFTQGEQQRRKQGGSGGAIAALADEAGGEGPVQVQQTIGQGRLDIRT
ncbi:flagellar hook-length control protein FliK [Thioclava sp. BHET1]|nr:flagellar hook-length control protein FliK [Thioclava sp. BHET1]